MPKRTMTVILITCVALMFGVLPFPRELIYPAANSAGSIEKKQDKRFTWQ